ncbi:MAG: restriction endonuclease subunit S [Methanoregula sp.]|nr:restriction endonuclease subunit S [Methanoregula sp.]
MSDSTDIPEGYAATELGALPEEWDVVNVGDTIQKTITLNPNKNPNYEFDYIDVSSVSSDTLTIVNTTHCIAHSCPSRARKIVEENDVIFATVRPSLRRVSQVPKNMNNRICSTAFCVLRSNPKKIDPSFLFYAVSYGDFVDRVSEHQRGVAYPAITDKEILEESIPLPPLPEQHAIATTLRTVQGAKEKTDDVITATKALKAAMMKHLFTYGPVPPEEAVNVALKETEIGQVPEEWEIRTVNELFDSKLGKMLSPVSKTGKFSKPYLRNANVQWGRVDISDLYEMDFSESSYDRYALIFGDVLICEGGEIGRTAIWRDEIKECYYQKAIHRLRPRDDRISTEFFSYHMMYAFLIGKTYSELGTTTTIAHLPGMKLKALLVPVPPRQVQDKIVTLLESIDQKLAAEQSHKEALDTLFASLLHDLMTAKIRVCTA